MWACSAAQGCVLAMEQLARLLDKKSDGLDGRPRDKEKQRQALRWRTRAAREGYVVSMHEVGSWISYTPCLERFADV